MQRPTCEGIRVRSPQDAHVIFHGVALGILPMITRRLDTEERRAITSGCVFVWEERGGRNTEPMGLGIERWTDSIRWGPSRVREEFLFYHEREHSSIDINIGMNYNSDAPPADILMRGKFVKQIYSVFLETTNGRRKWHLIAYFTKDTVDYLRTVDDIPHLACIKVPAGIYKSACSAQRTRRTRATEKPYLGAFGSNNRHIMAPRHVQEILLAPLEYLESLPPPRRHPVDEKALISFVPRLA
ncbi:Gti1/Pac2 family-domain-containing protein, partial [Mycena albidolilacea]